MNILKSIAVFCASSEGNDQVIIDQAQELGKTLAKQQITLVYGGANLGIMKKVADEALLHKGETIGVIPHFLRHREIAHPNLTELIITETMQERKATIYEKSDGFIILPGGFGTLDEFFEVSTWAQLGLHLKPIGLLNINGFYDDLLNMFKKMVSKGLLKQENYEMLIVDDNIESLLGKMRNYKAKPVPKWLKAERT